MGLKKTEAKEYARMLFLDTSQKLTNKEIADRVGVRPNTITKWIDQEAWKKLRKSLMVTRQKMIGDLYDQLEWLNNHIITRKVQYDVPEDLLKPKITKDKNGNDRVEYPKYNEEDFSVTVGNFATTKEANTIAVITTSIKRLETETSIAEIYEVATGFLDFIKPQDFDLYKSLVPLFDVFINSKLS
jgi:uncharacterized protein YjcR